MKVSNSQSVLLLLSACVTSSVTSASKVPVAIRVKNGKFDDIEGFDDPFVFSKKGQAAGFDTEVGVDVDLDLDMSSSSLDGVSMPYTIWGKIGRNLGAGWKFSARTDVDIKKTDSSSLNILASNDEWDTSLNLFASKGAGVEKVQMAQGFSAFNNGKIFIKPKYDLSSSEGDLLVGYTSEKTSVTVKASSDEKKLTVSQQITDSDRIAPSITTAGKFSLQWKRSLSDDDSITTTISPNDSINVKWEDGPWTAKVHAPVSGFEMGDVNVVISRKVDFLN